MPFDERLAPPDHSLSHLRRTPYHGPYANRMQKLRDWRPVDGLRRQLAVLGLHVSSLSPIIDPILKDTSVFGDCDALLEANVGVRLPVLHLKYCGGGKLIRVILLLAERKVARDDLVDGEDGELDVVPVLLMAKLCTQIEVEDLEMTGLGIDQEIPHGNVAVSDSQSEVEVVNGLGTVVGGG